MFWSSARKLAREAVIFMLLGWILLTVGMFVGLYATTPSKVKNTIQAPDAYPTPEQCRKLGLNNQMSSAQITAALQKATEEEDPGGFFSGSGAISDKLARQADICLKTQNQPQAPPEFVHNVDYSISGFTMESIYVGILGFPAGLGLWIFYRVVRFAIKG